MQEICQSCAMPFSAEFGADKMRGTEADGSLNPDYCIHCYKDGKFTNPNQTLDEAIALNAEFAEQNQTGMNAEQMRKYCEKVLPTLKRWKNHKS
jgi:hypothetical protein